MLRVGRTGSQPSVMLEIERPPRPPVDPYARCTICTASGDSLDPSGIRPATARRCDRRLPHAHVVPGARTASPPDRVRRPAVGRTTETGAATRAHSWSTLSCSRAPARSAAGARDNGPHRGRVARIGCDCMVEEVIPALVSSFKSELATIAVAPPDSTRVQSSSSCVPIGSVRSRSANSRKPDGRRSFAGTVVSGREGG